MKRMLPPSLCPLININRKKMAAVEDSSDAMVSVQIIKFLTAANQI